MKSVIGLTVTLAIVIYAIRYFSGWPDTLQLTYGNPELRQAMISELVRMTICVRPLHSQAASNACWRSL
jgi:hypothetical protein